MVRQWGYTSAVTLRDVLRSPWLNVTVPCRHMTMVAAADPAISHIITHKVAGTAGPRLRDWRSLREFDNESLGQATRCMIAAFRSGHNGCPLGNLIPEWNDLVRRRWRRTESAVPPTTPRLHRLQPGSVRAGVCAGHQPGSGDDRKIELRSSSTGASTIDGATASAAEARKTAVVVGPGAGGPATHLASHERSGLLRASASRNSRWKSGDRR